MNAPEAIVASAQVGTPIPLAALLSVPVSPTQVVCVDGRSTDAAQTSLNAYEWRSRVAQVRAALATRPAQRVALCLDDPLDMSCALFAAWAAGKTPVVLPNALAQTRANLAFAFDEAIDAALLTELAKPDEVTKTDIAPSVAPLSSSCELTIYTSGSTGEPKAITKTIDQLDGEVQTLHRHWGAQLQNALVVASVPCHHIYGLWFRILWPLAAGVPFARHTFADPSQAQSWRHRPAVVWIAGPAQLTRWPTLLGNTSWPDAPRLTFSSGGPLPEAAARQYGTQCQISRTHDDSTPVGHAPVEVFGSTETGGIAWRQQDVTSHWTPLDDTDVRVGDDNTLEIRSPRVNDGCWWRTDDGAIVHDDGSFALTGRVDRIVKIEGKRLALASVEATLTRHEWVADAAALVVAGRLAVVVVLSKAGNRAWEAQSLKTVRETLRRALAETFDDTMLPRRWRFLAALPVNERGKRTVADLAACFTPASQWLPSVLGVRPSDVDDAAASSAAPFSVVIALRVPPDLAHFKGHFPGLPLLPGVVLIDWATRFAAKLAREDAAHHAWVSQAPTALQQVKFSAPVLPGARLELTLVLDATRQRVQYSYEGARAVAATGYLAYAAPASVQAEVTR